MRKLSQPGRHVVGCFGHRPPIRRRISANSAVDIVTSASWNVTDRSCQSALAPIFISFSRIVVIDQCSISSGSARVLKKLSRL